MVMLYILFFIKYSMVVQLLTYLADVLRGEKSKLLAVVETLFLPVVLPCLRPEPGAVRGLNMPVVSV